jgi:hypothetical protein
VSSERIYGLELTYEELHQLQDMLTSSGWQIMLKIFQKDKFFSEALLLDHGISIKEGGLVFKLKSDLERGVQIGQHKMATKYLEAERLVRETLTKLGGTL